KDIPVTVQYVNEGGTDNATTKLEIVQSEDPAKEYGQMAQLFRLNIRPETIARLFGIGGKR
ncbi:MAG: hypothetical protein AAB859_01860, partial [Patescibacteria group bacterium]